jgi:hypothetical protein
MGFSVYTDAQLKLHAVFYTLNKDTKDTDRLLIEDKSRNFIYSCIEGSVNDTLFTNAFIGVVKSIKIANVMPHMILFITVYNTEGKISGSHKILPERTNTIRFELNLITGTNENVKIFSMQYRGPMVTLQKSHTQDITLKTLYNKKLDQASNIPEYFVCYYGGGFYSHKNVVRWVPCYNDAAFVVACGVYGAMAIYNIINPAQFYP